MKKFAKLKKFIPLLIIFILLLGGFIAFKFLNLNQEKKSEEVLSEKATPGVVIEVFSEKVEIKAPGENEFKVAQNNQEIPAGTTIKTNETGRAQLLYPNKSVTRIDFSSEVVLENFDFEENSVKVSLVAGKIWSRVAKIFGKGAYETESENLVATIRGTSYGHEILPNGEDKLSVTRSRVKGTCKNKAQEAEISFGKRATFNCLKNRRAALSLLNQQDRRDKWYLFNNDEDKRLEERFNKEAYGDEEILGIQATPTPTPKPSPSPSPTTTPTPTNTPTPQPTPTPNPLNIESIDASKCQQYNCIINITGIGFDSTTEVWVGPIGKNDFTVKFFVRALTSSQITAENQIAYSGNHDLLLHRKSDNAKTTFSSFYIIPLR